MVEWLLLDRIDAEAAGAPVREELDAPVLDPAHEAQPALPFMHPAGAWAHVALHPAVGPRVPITGIDHRLLMLSIGLAHRCLNRDPAIGGSIEYLPAQRNIGSMGHDFNEGAALSASRPPTAVRPAAVAGLFYPRDPEELSATVAALLAGQHGPARPPKALIVPHAGFVYSGNVAAQAYASLGSAARALRRVVVRGPSHREWFRGLAVPSVQAFATPLGAVRVDTAAVSRLCALPAVVRSDAAHALEHSLEVQLPFLQHVAPAAA